MVLGVGEADGILHAALPGLGGRHGQAEQQGKQGGAGEQEFHPFGFRVYGWEWAR